MANSLTSQLLQIPRNDSLAAMPVAPMVCAALIWANVFVCGAYFRGQVDVQEFSIHWQIILRLGIAFASGLAGMFWLLPMTYRDFISGAGLLLTLYCVWYGVTMPFAVEMTFSLASWASLVGVILLIPAAMRILGGAAILKTIAFSLMCFLAGSWFVYLFVPGIGVYTEWVTESIQIVRMGGLGHPNSLGLYSAFAILVFSGLVVTNQIKRSVAIVCIVLAAITLGFCFSRTAAIACLFGLVFTFQDQLRTRKAVMVAVAIACVLAFISFVVLGSGSADWQINDMLVKSTKSGLTTELTTANGRTDIWAYGMERILDSPIFGYGYCSGRFVMEFHSFHCHNIVLNAALYGGLPSAMLLTFIMSYLVWSMFTQPVPAIDGLAACILLGGMFDELIVSAAPSAAIVIWTTLVFWRQLGMSFDASPGHCPSSPNNSRPAAE